MRGLRAWGLGLMVMTSGTAWVQAAGDDGFFAVRSFVPAGGQVVWKGRADVEPTPGKEWVIDYLLAPQEELEFIKYTNPYRHLLIVRQAGGVWRRAFADKDFSDLEFRDLDADGMLEIIVWGRYKGFRGFRTTDFREGRFRTSSGLDFAYPEDTTQGFVDMDGNRTLELIANGGIPGYLSALVGDLHLTPEVRPGKSGDVRIYRFIEGQPRLYFPPPSPVLEGLKRGLASGYPETRGAAIEAAGILGAEALLPRLCELVKDPEDLDPYTVHRAIKALGRIGGPVAVSTLVEAADRPDLRDEAIRALSTTGAPAVVPVLLKWRDESWARLELARVLGQIEHPQRVQLLCECLRDEDDAVWDAAEESLQRLPASEVGEAVVQVLTDPGESARIVAARFLARAGDARGFRVLMQLVEAGSPCVSPADLQLLGRCGDQRAVPLLLSRALVHNGDLTAQAEASGAVLGLCEMGATETLATVADDYLALWRAYPRGMVGNRESYYSAARSLESIAERSPMPRLVNACLALLERREPDVRFTAIRVLGAAKVEQAVGPLAALLRAEPEPEIWLAAVDALGKIGGADALAALREAAASVEPDIAPKAEWEIIKLQGPEALSLLLTLSREGDHQATVRLAEFTGEDVERELARALREDLPDGSFAARWGDYQYSQPNDERGELTEGWFTKVSRRLGKAAIPILISRLKDAEPGVHHSATEASPASTEAAPWELRESLREGKKASAAAMAAAHCLREFGATEAIPALLQAATYSADEDVREVAMWSLVSLRRRGAGITGPLFPGVERYSSHRVERRQGNATAIGRLQSRGVHDGACVDCQRKSFCRRTRTGSAAPSRGR